MKKLTLLLLITGFFSCSKKDVQDTASKNVYHLRIAAIEISGAKSYTPIAWVKSGKVAVEFETADVDGVKEYHVEVSSDGINFFNRKTIAADTQNPNKLYTDTLILK
jgi:hypothetical protein